MPKPRTIKIRADWVPRGEWLVFAQAIAKNEAERKLITDAKIIEVSISKIHEIIREF